MDSKLANLVSFQRILDKFNVPSAHQTEPKAIVQMLTTTMSSHRKPRRQITGVAIPRGGPFLAVYYRSLIGS